MIEQEHFKQYEANDTFIHRQDWPKVDELIDCLIQKNESGYKDGEFGEAAAGYEGFPARKS